MNYTNHLTKAADLVTSREKTRAGFIAMALEKNYLAVPYVEEARTLKTLVSKLSTARDLLTMGELRASLLTASGLSDKALKHLNDEDKTMAVKNLIDKFLEPAADDFPNELVYRYLLTKGDTLGGSARNLAGSLGERKFIRAFLSLMNVYNLDYSYLDNDFPTWRPKPQSDVDLEKKLKAIAWTRDGKKRTLILNIKVPVVNKNVDLCLFSDHGFSHRRNLAHFVHNHPELYLACGELKGGVDPAGADEHWKTAGTALNRIRNGFKDRDSPLFTFFIGAAIENAMSNEIFRELEQGTLTNAANLAQDEQLTSVCDWLLSL